LNPMAPQPEMNGRDTIAAQALLAGLTELSARASHDLVGPLNQAGSLVALFIKRYRNQLDSEADKLLDFLQGASNRMEDVIAGIQRYMEIAGRPPRMTRVDLNASLASSLSLLEKPISGSGAVIESATLPFVSADAAHMVTIFESLIDNSIKFRTHGLPPRVQVSSARSGEALCIAVADNGIGVDPAYREAVFLPFKRLSGREYPGAGLGLAMAKLITEMHGGSIRIDSAQEFGGTSVKFTVQPD
jgi:light-regulated signal transduction histidine kinase (bacteriophytochrome)